MNLGDIFGKLAKVEIKTILNWYGRVTMGLLFFVVVLVSIFALTIAVWFVLTAVPWYALSIIFVLVTGKMALDSTGGFGEIF